MPHYQIAARKADWPSAEIREAATVPPAEDHARRAATRAELSRTILTPSPAEFRRLRATGE